MTENVYCPAEKAVLLSSFAVQAKLGDFDSETHTPGYLANEKILPPKVLSQHKLSIEEWEEKVSKITSRQSSNNLSRNLSLSVRSGNSTASTEG